MTSFVVSPWSIELEPEVEHWLQSLPPTLFAAAASRIDFLAEIGAAMRMPRSRSLGDGLFDLRFNLGSNAQRITFFCPDDRRAVLLTELRARAPGFIRGVERVRGSAPTLSHQIRTMKP